MTDPDAIANPDDVVLACADLARRAGAADFEIGYLHDDVPADQAGWYAQATYRSALLITDECPSPAHAALTLAERLLTGARCKCGRTVALSDREAAGDRCRWRLAGARWEPGCTAPPIRVTGTRGDLAAMDRAMAERWPPP